MGEYAHLACHGTLPAQPFAARDVYWLTASCKASTVNASESNDRLIVASDNRSLSDTCCQAMQRFARSAMRPVI